MAVPDPGDSLDLLRRAKDGDRECLSQLLERYGDRLLARVRLMMGDAARRRAESGDFLQGVFVEILQGLDRFEPRAEKDFLRWATAIARNNIRDHARKKREQAFASFSQSALLRASPDSAAGTPSQIAAGSEHVYALVEALEQLPEEHQQVIELRDFDGLSFADIAARMGRSDNAVQLLHTRAVTRLGAIVEQ